MRTTDKQKYYLLAEVTPLPGLIEEVKAIFSDALKNLVQEPGCEAIYTTSVEDEEKLAFFEIFSSEEAHNFHMQQNYTKQLAADLEGKLAKPLTMTKLVAF